jgi:hypothetical protein
MSKKTENDNEVRLIEQFPSDFPGEVSSGTHNGWRIVVVDRGWVVVGNCIDHGEHIRVEHARCIRVWGTERGLGQLMSGPTSETKHDWMGRIDVPMRAVIFTLIVADDAWSFPDK